jgi:YggT family protein
MFMHILHIILIILMAFLVAHMIINWGKTLFKNWEPYGPVAIIVEGVEFICEPILRFVGKVMKPIRLFSIRFDTAFMALFLLVAIGLQLTS